ncbi:hypothetical protein D3C87_2029190 [compost metagenome]
MYCVDVRIFQQFVVVGIAYFNAVLVTGFIQFRFSTLANRVHVGIGMLLINGDKLGAEA